MIRILHSYNFYFLLHPTHEQQWHYTFWKLYIIFSPLQQPPTFVFLPPLTYFSLKIGRYRFKFIPNNLLTVCIEILRQYCYYYHYFYYVLFMLRIVSVWEFMITRSRKKEFGEKSNKVRNEILSWDIHYTLFVYSFIQCVLGLKRRIQQHKGERDWNPLQTHFSWWGTKLFVNKIVLTRDRKVIWRFFK